MIVWLALSIIPVLLMLLVLMIIPVIWGLADTKEKEEDN